MSTDGFAGPSPFDSDLAVEESPEVLYSVVVTLVESECPDSIGPMDCDDMAHEVFLKVWMYRRTRPIARLKPFIRRVLRNVRIDMLRKYRPSLYTDFPRNEHGEINEDVLLSAETPEKDNPEWMVMQEEGHSEAIKRTADSFEALKGRQREATLCNLNAHKAILEDWSRMAAALEARGINADLEWSDDPTERQRLQSSYAPARRKMAQMMGEDLEQYKRRKQNGRR